jgi:hypothetical protein
MRRLYILALSLLALIACNKARPENSKSTPSTLTIESLTATPDAYNPLEVTFDWKIVNAVKEQCHLDVTADGQADFSFICAEVKSYVHSYSQANTYSAKLWVDGQGATSKEVSVKIEPVTPQPQLSEQVFTFDKTVTWAAYQKDGVWQRLELSKTGDTKLSLAVEQGAISFVCNSPIDDTNFYTRHTIIHFTHDGLNQFVVNESLESLPTLSCTFSTPPMPEQPTAKIRGTITGIHSDDSLSINFRNDTHRTLGLKNMTEPGYHYETFAGLPAGTYDAMAALFPNGASAPSHAIIDQNAVTIEDKDVDYDFDFSKAVVLNSYTLSLTGLENIESTWNTIGVNGLSMYSDYSFDKTTTITYSALPMGYLPKTDYSIYSHANADGCDYNFLGSFNTPSNLLLSAPPCAQAALQPKDTNKHFGLSWNFGVAFKPDTVGLSFEQGLMLSETQEGSGRNVSIMFLGDFRTMTSYALEDFSALSGWQPEWSLKDEATSYGFHYRNHQNLSDGKVQNSVSIWGGYKLTQ